MWRQEAGLLLKLLVHPEPEVRSAALTVMAATADDARPPPVTAQVHCKKRFAIFPSPAGMSLIELSLDGNNLIIPAQGEFVHLNPIPSGDGKIVNLFLQCIVEVKLGTVPIV